MRTVAMQPSAHPLSGTMKYKKEYQMKINKFLIVGVAVVSAVLLSGCVNISMDNHTLWGPNLGIQRELRNARTKLDDCYTGSQSEMTMVSGFQLALAQMELDHVRYTIWNQSNYGKIEAAFSKDEEAWERRLKAEMETPSEFEGGSMAPMDNNQRMIALIEGRIAELKEKWCEKNR